MATVAAPPIPEAITPGPVPFETIDAVPITGTADVASNRPGWLRRIGFAVLVWPFQLFCLMLVLGTVSMVPLLQLIAFGYLLDVAGRILTTGRIRDGFTKLEESSKLVLAAAALYAASLPAMMFGSWANSARWISDSNPASTWSRVGAFSCAGIAFVYLLWTWARGGRLRDYVWPAPIRFVKEGWRFRFWADAHQRLWVFLGKLEAPRLFWLGARGLVGTFMWIGIPAIMLIGATRGGETGLAGLVGFAGVMLMGLVLLYLPFLQAQFAADNRFRSMFAVRRARRCFRRSPLAYWIALALTLLLAIPPYLLKIEAVPAEFAWVFAAMVVAFIFPGRVLTGWASARSARLEEPKGFFGFVWRNTFRLASLPVVGFYLIIVYGTQFTSWNGLATWLQQHAISVPAPF